MKTIRILGLAMMLSVSLSGCSIVHLTPDFRPQTGLSPAEQQFPLRLDAIRTGTRANLSTAFSEKPCRDADYHNVPCTKAEDIQRYNSRITVPLLKALADTFAQTQLFSPKAAKGVRLTAEVLSFETRSSVVNKAKTVIRYDFADSESGRLIHSETVESSSWETSLSPIDMGRGFDNAFEQAGQNNIRKLLERLQNPKHNAALRVQ